MERSVIKSIQEAFSRHGLAAHMDGETVQVQDGLNLRTQITASPNPPSGKVVVQLDVISDSPRLEGKKVVDSFAGIGPTQEAAESNAFIKFLTGSFHVVAESLTSHQCSETQVEWESWSSAKAKWRVCSGPALIMSSGKPPYRLSEVYKEFPEEVKRLFLEAAPPGAHWFRVFFASMQGKMTACEVVVDGYLWPEAQEKLAALCSNLPEHYETLRHLCIVLPDESVKG